MNDWIWMPHAAHFCAAHMCRFHLSTYVNGYIISTVGEYLPPQECLRSFLRTRIKWPKLEIDKNGKLREEKCLTDEELDRLLSLKGDDFEAIYLNMFGFEKLGMNRTYETMVFRAKKREETQMQCCPYEAYGDCLRMKGYINPVSAYKGHLSLCYDWQTRPHGSENKEVMNEEMKE
jgi:hypothetical protein